MTRLQFLPLFLSFFAASAAAQAPGTTILDQGRLEYRLRGEPCGHEDFVVEEGEGRITWRSSSRLELRAPDGRSLTVEIDVRAVYAGEGGRPRTLLSIREDIRTSEIAGKPIQIWGQFTRPRDSQLIIEQPDPGMASRLVLPVVFDPDGSLTPPRERGRPRPQGEWTGDESPLEPLVVIDSNGGYALYGAAARMASRAYGRVERVYAIVPQADKSAGVASELAVSLEAQQGVARKVKLEIGGQVFQVRLGVGGRLEKVSVPQQEFEAVRIGDRAQGDPGSFGDEAEADVEEPPVEASTGTDQSFNVRLSNGNVLAGALRMPRGSALRSARGLPAVLLLSEDGLHDRDGNVPPSRATGLERFSEPEGATSTGDLLAVLADALARKGIATYRFDDPGVGASLGHLDAMDLRSRIVMATDALRALKGANGVDAARVAILGHGEGGLIAPRVVVEGREGAAALVLVGAPADSLGALHLERRALELRREEKTAAEIEQELLPRKQLYNQILSARSWHDVVITDTTAEQGLLRRELAEWRTTKPFAWFQQHLAAEPRLMLVLAQTPALIVTGGKDARVPPQHALELGKTLEQAGGIPHEVITIPYRDHYLRETSAHRTDPEAAQRIADWLARQLR